MNLQDVSFKYNVEKVIEATQLLLKLGGNQIEYTRIIKLLYLADREALNDWGRSITTDIYFSMKHGVVISRTLNLIKKQDPNAIDSEIWNKYIEPTDEYDIKIKEEKRICKLSKREVALLENIHAKYKDIPTWGEEGLIEIIHQLPEWDKKAELMNTSIPLSLKSLFTHLNKNEQEIDEVLSEIKAIYS